MQHNFDKNASQFFVEFRRMIHKYRCENKKIHNRFFFNKVLENRKNSGGITICDFTF